MNWPFTQWNHGWTWRNSLALAGEAIIAAIIAAALVFCNGCSFGLRRGEPFNPPKVRGQGHQQPAVIRSTNDLIAAGWTVTNWNAGECWIAPGTLFHPRTPPLPDCQPNQTQTRNSLAYRTVTHAEAAGDALGAVEIQPSGPLVIHVTPEFQNVVVFDGEMKPDGGWLHDTNVYSPNYIVVDNDRASAPHNFTSQK